MSGGGAADRTERLGELDHRHLWHPFTQMEEWFETEPLIVERGEGNWLIDSRGRRYLDGVSSLWCNVHGHRHPVLDEALAAQAGKIAHSTMLGMSNPPAIELAERLCSIVPSGLSRVFYAENGASAVEIAIKMAYQYWQHVDAAERTGDGSGAGTGDATGGRTKFVGLELAYHGDTIGAVSVGGIDTFHAAFRPLLFDAIHAPAPFPYRFELGDGTPEACRDHCLGAMDEILTRHAGEVVAVIIEPLVQGAAGIIVHPPGFLRGMRDLCDRHGVLLICDEVATGFGRTGAMFACEHEGVSPDMLVIGKGLTGGYLPLSAVLTTEQVFSAFLGGYDEFKTFFHGHTYTGNPLACAVALANLDIFEGEQTIDGLAPKIEQLGLRLGKLAGSPHVGDIRVRGLMAGIELVSDTTTAEPFDPADRIGMRVCTRARDFEVAIRPLGDVLVVMPPLSITEEEIDHLCDGVETAMAGVLSEIHD